MPATAAVLPTAPVVIDEVYGGGGNSGATYKNDFVVLRNTTDAAIPLAGWSLQYRSATGTGAFANTAPLSGSIAAQDYLLVKLAVGAGGTTELPEPNLVVNPLALSGTAGQIALVNSTAQLPACTGGGAATSCSLAASVIDFVGWGSATDYAGTGPAPATTNTTSISRSAAHTNTADNAADFTVGAPTPNTAGGGGTPTDPPEPPDPTHVTISDIQGTRTTPGIALGTTVTTRGLVTALYPTGGLNGFVIQTPGTGGDIDLASWAGSTALFVYLGGQITEVPNLAIGDYVSVTGTTAAYQGLEQLSVTSGADVVELSESVPTVAPVTVPWPRSEADREALESMLYQPTDPFLVSNTYDTNRYGTVGLASGSTPLVQPTEVVPSSDPDGLAAVKADNAARAVILDDAATVDFTTAANAKTNTPSYISTTTPVRVGAKATITAPVVIDYRNNAWTLNPTTRVQGPANAGAPVAFENTRTAAPDAQAIAQSGTPALKVASFNVLNYFTTTGASVGGCSSYKSPNTGDPVTVNSCPGNGPRGAWAASDLKRQQDKIVAAISALDADVVGLMEIENSEVLGETPDEAVATLVAALNAEAGSTVWDYVHSPGTLPPVSQMDVISCAIIYRQAAVSLVGASASIPDQSGSGKAFSDAREPIAQAFQPAVGGDPFLFVVNHFKSKGSGAAPQPPYTEEGNANASRVAQAGALATWVDGLLPTYPEGVEAVYLAGDFNAYSEELPILTLREAGYQDVAQAIAGSDRKYSYSYSGLAGSLDHVLANAAALDRVTGADIWNINSGESIALEYSRYLYSPTDFYTPDPYRSSDHDPVVVGVAGGAQEPGLDVDYTVASRCIAGKSTLTVTAVNASPQAVDLALATAYGLKSYSGIQPGKSAFSTLTTRLAVVPAGTVTVTVSGLVDGQLVTTTDEVAYPQFTC
jgi:5'-nucleotidase